MNYIYLDLNVFDKIEKIEQLSPEEAEPYQYILNFLKDGTYITFYSNAHISDLIRGYNNSPSGDTTAVQGHLQNLSNLTNNRCMCLYWNEIDVKIDTRDVFDFFNSSLQESLKMETSTESLLSFEDEDSDTVSNILKASGESVQKLLNGTSIQEEMNKAFEYPIFKKLFPKAYENKKLAFLVDDMLTLQERMDNDPSLYRGLKALMNPQQTGEFIKALPPSEKISKKELNEIFKTFDLEAAIEEHTPKTQTSENPWYDKITNLYTRIDFKGFKTDKGFSNMIDDSNHTFYGAHCNFFITRDDRCHYKATEVYKQLGIGSKVMKPEEFMEYIKNQEIAAKKD